MRFALVLVVLLHAASAQGEAGLTLADAVAAAREHHPALRAARERAAAAAGRIAQAAVLPNPELAFSAEEVSLDGGGMSDSQTMVGLTQTVPLPGKRRLAVREAEAGGRRAHWEYRALERETVLAVKVAFGRALAAEHKLAITGDLAALAATSADAAAKRVAAGAASAQEQLRAEVDLERSRSLRMAAERERVEAREQLALLMGLPDTRSRPLAGALAEMADTNVLAQALGPDPRFAAAEAEAERAAQAWSLTRREALPDVTLAVAFGRDREADQRVAEWSVSLPLPLFDRARGSRQAAAAEYAAALAEVDGAEQRRRGDRAMVEARLHAAADGVLASRERILPKAEEALRLVRAGFGAGQFGVTDLLDTQRILAEARLAHEDRLLDLHTALAELESLTQMDVGGR